MGKDKGIYSVADVAQDFGVSPQTVRNWIQDRKIIAIQPSGQNGVYRIPVASVNAMKRRMGELPAAAIRTEMPRAESPG